MYFLQREVLLNSDSSSDELNLNFQIDLTIQAAQLIDMALPEANGYQPTKHTQRRRFGK
jgi:hypothetical protein